MSSYAPGHRTEYFQILVSRKVQIEIRFFNDSANPSENSTSVFLKILPENLNRTRRRPEKGQDHSYGRALTRSVRPEERKNIASMDFDIQILDGPAFPKLLA